MGLQGLYGYRISYGMDNTYANAVIDALGGTTAVASLMNAPVSTVHTWRKKGIPASRMAHIRLLAKTTKLTIPAQEPTP